MIRATFFVIGKNVELYPETVKRIIAEGHVLGNHSYSHDAVHTLTQYDSDDLKMAQEVIYNTVGVRPHLYRPPRGAKTPWELESAEELGMITITCVNRQGKWDTIGTKDNGHLGACSCSLEEVKYRLRKEQDHDTRSIR